MASVLDTFYLLFDSDAKDAAKGLGDVEGAADDAASSLDDAATASADADTSFTTLMKTAAGAAAALFTISTAYKAIDMAQQIDQLGKTADMWGYNVEQAERYGQIVNRQGGTVDGFIGSLNNLNSGLQEIAMTGEGSLLPFFNLFGINALDASGKAKSAFDILPQLADQFQKLSKGEAVSLGQQLGLDDATIRMLMLGGKELDEHIKRQKELGNVTKEQTEISAKFNNSLGDAGQVLGTLGRKILTGALPFVTAFTDVMTDFFVFINQNQSIMEGFFVALTALMIPFAATALASSLPFIGMAAAIGGVVTAITLLYDEMKAWVSGQDSLLGRWLGSWDKYATKLFDIIDKIKDRFKAAKAYFGFGGDIGISEGQAALNAASASGLASTTSTAIANSSKINNGGNVSIGELKVETQATDADGIAKDIASSLNSQMKSTRDSFDDGLVA